ncbi:hypothetical protein HGA91_03350 [candidate division WWE3 bacterium]|nr:hypothetical protein [candidate division WWE3 bacterium]
MQDNNTNNSLWINQANNESLDLFNAQPLDDAPIYPTKDKKFLRTFSKLSEIKFTGIPMVISITTIGLAVTIAAVAPFINTQLDTLFPKKESSAASLTPTPSGDAGSELKGTGDIDGDGEIDVYDVGLFASYYDKSESANPDSTFTAADFDDNKKIDVYDLGYFASKYPLKSSTKNSISPTPIVGSSSGSIDDVLKNINSFMQSVPSPTPTVKK